MAHGERLAREVAERVEAERIAKEREYRRRRATWDAWREALEVLRAERAEYARRERRWVKIQAWLREEGASSHAFSREKKNPSGGHESSSRSGGGGGGGGGDGGSLGLEKEERGSTGGTGRRDQDQDQGVIETLGAELDDLIGSIPWPGVCIPSSRPRPSGEVAARIDGTTSTSATSTSTYVQYATITRARQHHVMEVEVEGGVGGREEEEYNSLSSYHPVALDGGRRSVGWIDEIVDHRLLRSDGDEVPVGEKKDGSWSASRASSSSSSEVEVEVANDVEADAVPPPPTQTMAEDGAEAGAGAGVGLVTPPYVSVSRRKIQIHHGERCSFVGLEVDEAGATPPTNDGVQTRGSLLTTPSPVRDGQDGDQGVGGGGKRYCPVTTPPTVLRETYPFGRTIHFTLDTESGPR